MRMEEGLDTGPVYLQSSVPIAEDATTPVLTEALAQLGSQLLIDVLAALQRGEASATPQPAEGVTLAPRLRREDGILEWKEHSAVDIDRRVRALQPWPGVTLPLAGVRVRILDGTCGDVTGTAEPGTVVRREVDAVLIAAADGAYWVHRVLPPGARPMSAAAFLRGRRVPS